MNELIKDINKNFNLTTEDNFLSKFKDFVKEI